MPTLDIEPDNITRRLAVIEVSSEWLAQYLLNGQTGHIIRTFDIGGLDLQDLEIIAVREAPPWNHLIELLCQSSAFPTVHPAMDPPHIRLMYRVKLCCPPCGGPDANT